MKKITRTKTTATKERREEKKNDLIENRFENCEGESSSRISSIDQLRLRGKKHNIEKEEGKKTPDRREETKEGMRKKIVKQRHEESFVNGIAARSR